MQPCQAHVVNVSVPNRGRGCTGTTPIRLGLGRVPVAHPCGLSDTTACPTMWAAPATISGGRYLRRRVRARSFVLSRRRVSEGVEDLPGLAGNGELTQKVAGQPLPQWHPFRAPQTAGPSRLEVPYGEISGR